MHQLLSFEFTGRSGAHEQVDLETVGRQSDSSHWFCTVVNSFKIVQNAERSKFEHVNSTEVLPLADLFAFPGVFVSAVQNI